MFRNLPVNTTTTSKLLFDNRHTSNSLETTDLFWWKIILFILNCYLFCILNRLKITLLFPNINIPFIQTIVSFVCKYLTKKISEFKLSFWRYYRRVKLLFSFLFILFACRWRDCLLECSIDSFLLVVTNNTNDIFSSYSVYHVTITLKRNNNPLQIASWREGSFLVSQDIFWFISGRGSSSSSCL